MTIVIDKEFSVYALLERMQKEGTILNHRRTMSLISYEIENATLRSKAYGRIFAGFQRLSKFIPQIPRYERLAKLSEHVYVFGIPDSELPPLENITYVPLTKDHQLAKEWFLVSHGLDYHTILATEELTDIDDPDDSRIFQGVWIFDLDMVRIVEEWLSSAVDARPLDLAMSKYNFQRQSKILSGTMQSLLDFRMNNETALQTNSAPPSVITGQLKTVVKESIGPSLAKMQASTNVVVEDEKDVVIFFSDIRDFTALAEKMSPTDLVKKIINPYVDIVSNTVLEFKGSIDKFLGDGILAVFGIDEPIDDAGDCALKAAVKSLHTLQRQENAFQVGFGLARGRVLLGHIGTGVVHEKTVIGDVVNLAQRLSSLGYNGIWLEEELYNALPNTEFLESMGKISLKGKSQPQEVFRYAGSLTPK